MQAIERLPVETRRRLLSLTFNNLGCYYKKYLFKYIFHNFHRKEKPNVALFYLNQSLELEMLDPRSE